MFSNLKSVIALAVGASYMVPNDAAAGAQTSVPAVDVANLVTMTKMNFHFKKDKLTSVKRPSVELEIPVPNLAGIQYIASVGGKELQLLLDTVSDVIYLQARAQVADDESITQEKLKLAPLLWSNIANLPKGERRGSSITPETWEDFGKDYLEVMAATTGKSLEKLSKAVQIYSKKLNPVRSDKDVLTFLKDQLAQWYSATSNKEDFAEVFQFLSDRITSFLASDEKILVENL